MYVSSRVSCIQCMFFLDLSKIGLMLKKKEYVKQIYTFLPNIYYGKDDIIL